MRMPAPDTCDARSARTHGGGAQVTYETGDEEGCTKDASACRIVFRTLSLLP